MWVLSKCLTKNWASDWSFASHEINLVRPFPINIEQTTQIIMVIDYFSKWIEAKDIALTKEFTNGILSALSLLHWLSENRKDVEESSWKNICMLLMRTFHSTEGPYIRILLVHNEQEDQHSDTKMWRLSETLTKHCTNANRTNPNGERLAIQLVGHKLVHTLPHHYNRNDQKYSGYWLLLQTDRYQSSTSNMFQVELAIRVNPTWPTTSMGQPGPDPPSHTC